LAHGELLKVPARRFIHYIVIRDETKEKTLTPYQDERFDS
jgi:hypothetical protein